MKKHSFVFLLFFVFSYSYVSAQIITTIAGCDLAGYSGDGGPATSAKIGVISSVAVDTKANIYISDNSHNVVRKVNPTGIISTFAGNGTQGFSGDNGPATAAQLYLPECITFDKKGNIYIYDGVNARVRKVDTAGIITTFAGNGLVFSGDGGPATAAGLGGGGWYL